MCVCVSWSIFFFSFPPSLPLSFSLSLPPSLSLSLSLSLSPSLSLSLLAWGLAFDDLKILKTVGKGEFGGKFGIRCGYRGYLLPWLLYRGACWCVSWFSSCREDHFRWKGGEPRDAGFPTRGGHFNVSGGPGHFIHFLCLIFRHLPFRD